MRRSWDSPGCPGKRSVLTHDGSRHPGGAPDWEGNLRHDEARELFGYNAWANRRLFDGVAGLAPDEYARDLHSSHGGVGGTIAHLVWAEHLWLTRWRGLPPPAVVQGQDLLTLDQARGRWEEIERERAAWLDGVPPDGLDATITVHPSTGGAFRHSFQQMFRHFVNHSSYHRGQVVTLLRQLGHRPPSTDLIYFYRS